MHTALLIVDVQYDFLPGGTLAVAEGNDILPVVHKLLNGKWDFVAASQDFHPAGHVSFASTHSKEVFTSTTVPVPNAKPGMPTTIEQMLWPDHCVQQTHGSEIEQSVAEALQKWIARAQGCIVQKGTDIAVEAYSAFASPVLDPSSSSLAQDLRTRGVDTLVVVGLATDYCVRASALDASAAGFRVYVIEEGVRAVGGEEATRKTVAEWKNAGIDFISLTDPVVNTLL